MTTIIVEIKNPNSGKNKQATSSFEEFLNMILPDLEGCTGNPETCKREDCPKKKPKDEERVWA